MMLDTGFHDKIKIYVTPVNYIALFENDLKIISSEIILQSLFLHLQQYSSVLDYEHTVICAIYKNKYDKFP